MFYTNLERTYRCPLAVYINAMLNGEFVFHTCISVYTDCITNFKVCNVCKQEDIMVSLAQRKWTWIGHVIGKDPREEKTKGCPKTTWRRSAEKELNTYIWPGARSEQIVFGGERLGRPYASHRATRADDVM